MNLDETNVMVFQKEGGGGHLAAHEKWFINGQKTVGSKFLRVSGLRINH